MFDSFMPDSSKPLDSSLNPSVTGLVGNVEQADAITPPTAARTITGGGDCQEAINISEPKPAPDDSLVLPETPFALKSVWDIHQAGDSRSSGDLLVGQAGSSIVERAISSAHSYLRTFATDLDFSSKMNLAFGDSWDAEEAGNLAQDWLTGDFSEIPAVVLRAGAEINRANGAFAAETDTIYISREFLAQNAGSPEAIASVVLEEIGHYIDSRVNTSDAAGDEGAIFAGAVQGKEFDAAELQALKAEDDTATVMLDGKAILIEQDNTLSAARAITVGSTASTYSDWVGTADTSDFYRFSLNNSSNFSLTLNGLSADADVQLLDSNGAVIEYPWQVGTASESISRTLDAGTYYVQVLQYSGDTNYNLSLQATPQAPADYAGNSLSAARAITVGPTTSTWSDWVGTADTSDYYRFSLSNSSNFSLTLNGLSADADVQLLDSSGNWIDSSSNGGNTADTINRTLDAGTYYVQVLQYGGDTNYNLSLQATPQTPADYAGNSLSAARAITVGPTTSTWSDWVGEADTNDYYRFSLNNSSNFSLSLNGLSADADVQLLDSSGNVIQGSYYSSTTADTISRALNAGTYYVQVYPMSGVNTNYNLSLSAVPSLPTVTISATDASAGETLSGQTPNPGAFTVSRTGSTAAALTVNYSVAGTATKGTDYSNLTGSVTIAAGATSAALPVSVIDDSLVEGSETAAVTLTSSTAYTVGSANSATVTIADNDVKPTVTISATDASAGETLSGQSANPGAFTISRTGSTAAALTVNYSVAGTATKGTDYSNLTGSVTIAAGATRAALPINVIDDSLVESNETATLTLAANTAYTVGSANTATVTIADNDVKPTVTISATDASAGETLSGQSANPGAFTIRRTGSTAAALTVNYSVAGTATKGTDYSNLTGSVTIAAGATSAALPVNVIDDSLVEGSETAAVTLTSSTAYTVGSANSATVTIADNDVKPTVTISATDASAGETLSGQSANPGAFTISRTGSTAAALTVNYSVAGTATKGTDYSNLTGSVTIAAGATRAVLPVNVIDDSLVEGSETAAVTLTSSTAYTVGSANTATVTIADNDVITDWFTQNIRDAGLQSAARSRATDSVLNRNDMIAIFRDAKDGTVIDATELADLRTLVSNASRFNMPGPVRVLSNKIANGNTANQWYQGGSLGNLYAGSSATQMENLIGKWFLGSDRPTAPYTYQYASGSLFQNGVSYQDINQGGLGDCYFLAGLAATAFRAPSTIQSMFTDNGDNTYTVRFYNSGVADYVTVDRYLPTYAGSLVYASKGNAYSSSANELWVALAEKAYAQMNESGWLDRNSTNTYSGIEGGSAYFSMGHATGRNTSSGSLSSSADTNTIANTFNAGQLITIGSKESGVASNVVSRHEYTLVGYNSSTQKFTLFNPWGVNGGSDFTGTFKPGILLLTSSQLIASFDYWAYTTESGQRQFGSTGLPPREFFT